MAQLRAHVHMLPEPLVGRVSCAARACVFARPGPFPDAHYALSAYTRDHPSRSHCMQNNLKYIYAPRPQGQDQVQGPINYERKHQIHKSQTRSGTTIVSAEPRITYIPFELFALCWSPSDLDWATPKNPTRNKFFEFYIMFP